MSPFNAGVINYSAITVHSVKPRNVMLSAFLKLAMPVFIIRNGSTESNQSAAVEHKNTGMTVRECLFVNMWFIKGHANFF